MGNDVRFVRIRGRIVPIRQRKTPGQDAAAVAGGAFVAKKGADAALGRVTVHHGTRAATVPTIKAFGLSNAYSNTGEGSIKDVARYKEASKGHIFVTRIKPIARMYAGELNGLRGNDKAIVRRMFNPFANKGIVTAKVPQRVWDTKFHSDPVGFLDGRRIGKGIEARAPISLGAESIVGSKKYRPLAPFLRAENLKYMVMKRPGKLALGLAAVGVGGALVARGIKGKKQ